MKKLRIIIAFLFITTGGNALFAQTPIPVSGGSTISFYVATLETAEDGSLLQDIFLNFNSEKIIDVNVKLATKSIVITHTSLFNEIEALAMFRQYGFEAYFVEGGFAYRLNGLGSDLVKTSYSPTEK